MKVLGTGCAKCRMLEENVRKALDSLGIDKPVGHVTRIEDIVSYGVMSTPALVIGREVVSVGKVLSEEEAVELIKSRMGVFA